ncbi:S41 family peptidase [Metamycoplasma buccale]|uniref:S41 family peptidase n=1 Tax=Metamycoplasma buccale TaxID=55602 RepID=UPI00398E6BAC
MTNSKKLRILATTIMPVTTFAIMPVLAAACGETSKPQNDDTTEITKQEYDYENTDPDYKVETKKLTAYYKKDSKSPYVDMLATIKALEGFLKASDVKVKIDKNKNEATLTVGGNKMILNWEKNTIWVNSTNFFSFTHSSLVTDYERYIRDVDGHSINDDNKGVTFNLSKFNLDILYHQGKILMPFSLFNTLFCSLNYHNIYFNGQKFYGVNFALNDRDVELTNKIRKSSPLQNTQPTKEQREATMNHFYFVMHYFYGLKDFKKIDDFKKFIPKDEQDKMLSTDPKVYSEAYTKFFYKTLDELHTRMNNYSYYDKVDKKVATESAKYNGDFRTRFYETRKKLVELREKKLGKKRPIVRYKGDTAIISFDVFQTGSNEDIKKADGYNYDTHILMRYAMNEISKHPEIKNVVMDLSLNGGGQVSAMSAALGFLTDRPIRNREYDTLNRREDNWGVDVDTDGNGQYENDAYTKYKWYVHTGINTFSAANQLVSIAKEMGIAKTIGQRSGGGMSAILPIVFEDGTTTILSSPNTAVLKDKKTGKLLPIESGLDPDITLPYEDYYNDDKLVDLIHKDNKQ